MTVFNIPALVPLVPGVPAYQAVRALVVGDYSQGENLLLRVAIVTGAIALGFMLSTMCTEVFFINLNIVILKVLDCTSNIKKIVQLLTDESINEREMRIFMR